MGLFDWWSRGIQKIAAAQAELEEIRAELDFLRTRLSTYLGDGIALTYLVDEAPIFVNANDIGGPFNLINGGRYEEENTQLLLSFLRPDTVFLDIGANLGYFSVKIGRRLGEKGRVYAFEPHPKLYDLLRRNSYINNLDSRLTGFNLALSNQDGTIILQYPDSHLGGGHIDRAGEVAGHTAVSTEMRRLDDLLGPDFRCDLVKIDVEGHELGVLEGMQNIVENSPEIKILFEKLVVNAGYESAIETYFRTKGFGLYAVHGDASLSALDEGALAGWSGYVLAVRADALGEGLKRARFSVHAAQLWTPSGPACGQPRYIRTGNSGDMLFHGPYWFLPSGIWRLKLHGAFRGRLRIALLHRFGHQVADCVLEQGQTEHVFVIRRYMVHFECAAYVVSATAEVDIERLEFIREY